MNCGGGFIDNRNSQFVNDGGTVAFNGALKMRIFGFMSWSAVHNQ